MLIGELSERSGIPARTLRFYEEAGVLAEPDRTANGYRDYDEGAVERLAFVRAAQGADLTLAEIRTVIGIRTSGGVPCAHVVELLEDKAADVARRLEELRALQRELDRLWTRADELDPAACDPRSVCAVLSPR